MNLLIQFVWNRAGPDRTPLTSAHVSSTLHDSEQAFAAELWTCRMQLAYCQFWANPCVE